MVAPVVDPAPEDNFYRAIEIIFDLSQNAREETFERAAK